MQNTNSKLVYNYAIDTKEYLDSQLALSDPLDGGFLLPAYATFTPPPAISKNQQAVFDIEKQSWNLVADYRGLKYWDSTGKDVVISELGIAPPADARYTPPPVVFDTAGAKDRLLASYKAKNKELSKAISDIFSGNFMVFTYVIMPDALTNPLLESMAKMQDLSTEAYVNKIKGIKSELETAQKELLALLLEAKKAIEEVVSEHSANEVEQKYDYKFLQIQENIKTLEDNLEG